MKKVTDRRIRDALRKRGPSIRHTAVVSFTDDEYILLAGLSAKLHTPISQIIRAVVVGMMMRNEAQWEDWRAAARAEHERKET